MTDKLRGIEQRYGEIEARLAANETYEDPDLVSRLNKEQRELEPLVTAYRSWCKAEEDLRGAEALLSDPDFKDLAQEEMAKAREELERLEQLIRELLLPRDPNDDKNVIVEIRAGVGGEESALFAHSLTRMYTMYAEKRGWKVEVNSVSETELGGVKDISLTISGDGAYSRLKFESGVHRVQRVPETESGGRIHTSTATVAVLPIDITGRPVYVGFDMSAKIDLTSITFVIPVLDGERVIYWIHSHSFVPNRAKLRERTSKDKAPYDLWERQGYITCTDSEIVDQSAVMAYVLEYVRVHNLKIVSLCFDPANASKLMMDLDKEGYDVQEVYQSVKSLNEATQGFREQVYAGNVRYERNPVLNFSMANAVVRSSGGLIKIDKDKARKRIDPVDSTLCGFKLAMYHTFGRKTFDLQKWAAQDW